MGALPLDPTRGVPRGSARPIRRRGHALGALLAASILTAVRASGQIPSDLTKLSLEELFAMEVTSVSRKPEMLSRTAAALHVVTEEDIRRSGALSIPEALCGIPGVEVARVDSRQYAITARGFNGTVANKLLVLLDGRSLYTPLFSGVFWDVQDTLMEDIARIEVIRGPGATVWGANAVNGVINVITKSAGDTQGLLVTGGAGNEERGFAGVRYGAPAGPNASFRVYTKYFDRDASALPSGADAQDRFRMAQSGFRLDWKPSTEDLLTVQGDVYRGSVGQPPPGDDIDLGGGNVLGRWTRHPSQLSSHALPVYYDRTARDIPPIFGDKLDTYDVDLHHRFPLGSRQDVVWGLGYRRNRDDVDNSPTLAFLPPDVTRQRFTAFLQDEFTLVADELHVSLGSKFEHNDYTGFEYMPSARVAWTPTSEQTVWAAVSRAVRTPSRIDREFFVPGAPPFLLAGGPKFESEVLHAYELGYKTQPAALFAGSLATFYNVYEGLKSVEAGPPAFIANGLEGRAYGAEVEATCQVRRLRVEAGSTLLRLQLRPKSGSTDTTQARQEGDSPRHQFFVRSFMDLPRDVEFDVAVRHVGELPDQVVPAYTALDARLAWKRGKSVEVAIIGQNLLDRRHVEFGMPAVRREIERSLYAKGTWRF